MNFDKDKLPIHSRCLEMASEAKPQSGSASAFVMDRMPWEKEWTIRIVIPGIDRGGAVWLEATSELPNRNAAEDLLDVVMAALPKVKRDKRPNESSSGTSD
jgi:hypothetical protein